MNELLLSSAGHRLSAQTLRVALSNPAEALRYECALLSSAGHRLSAQTLRVALSNPAEALRYECALLSSAGHRLYRWRTGQSRGTLRRSGLRA